MFCALAPSLMPVAPITKTTKIKIFRHCQISLRKENNNTPQLRTICNRLYSAYATRGAIFGFGFSVSLEHGRIFRLER